MQADTSRLFLRCQNGTGILFFPQRLIESSETSRFRFVTWMAGAYTRLGSILIVMTLEIAMLYVRTGQFAP